MRRKSKAVRILRIILGDTVLLAVCLLSFAYFHHVRIPELETKAVSNFNYGNVENTPSAPKETPMPLPSETPFSIAFSEDPDTTASAPEPTPFRTPSPNETGLLKGKFAEKFTETIVTDETGYHSPNVSIDITTEDFYKSKVLVADIYINDISSFRTAVFSEFDRHYMQTLDMANAANAILAISGDHFYAHLQSGVLAVRNGIVFSDQPNAKQDACVLYQDGTVEIYKSDAINVPAIFAKNPVHVWYFGPGLLDENGQPFAKYQSTVADVNPRSALGYYEPGHYCFVMVEGRFKDSVGVTLSELADIFSSLGCKAAYNLDGGKTSVMTFNGKRASRLLGGGRPVADILYIVEPSETEALH